MPSAADETSARGARGAAAVGVLARLLLLLLCGSCSREAPTPPLRGLVCPGCSVLLITVDALRADVLPCYGGTDPIAPRICGLAKEGLLFEHAYTAVPMTWFALDALMTGTVTPRPRERALAEDLRDRGYATGSFSDHPLMLGKPVRWGGVHLGEILGRGFKAQAQSGAAGGLDRAPEGDGENTERVDRAAAWLGENRSGPFFLWTHFYEPHAPYDPPDGKLRLVAGGDKACPASGGAVASDGSGRQEATGCAFALYKGEVAEADQRIGELLDLVGRTGLMKKTLIVVTADHGESFEDHGNDGHGLQLYEEAIRVPLIVRTPATALAGPRRVAETVSAAEIANWIRSSIAGEEPTLRTGAVSMTRMKTSSFFSLVEGRAKVIINGNDLQGASFEFYDLEKDPRERRSAPDDPRAEPLRRKLLAWIRENDPRNAESTPESLAIDRMRQRRMEALGYIQPERPAPERWQRDAGLSSSGPRR
jgi:hypothetical protein